MTIAADVEATRFELAELDTELLSAPLEYAALTPGGDREGLPLLYLLHGGGGSRDFLEQARPWIEAAWADGSLPRCVVVTPSVSRSFYMNYRDGSERWEDAVVGPLLDHVRDQYGASSAQEDTALTGVSMGGMGGLRIAFKHPEKFGAVAALEPGIEPVLSFADIAVEDRFWRDDALFERIYGSPVDEEYWKANNPANIALADPERLARSGLAIYLECGDKDRFGLDRGTEFLHRVLYDQRVSHEYRLVRGADHIGASLPARFADAFAFLGRVFEPPPPDPALEPFHKFIDQLRQRAGLAPLS